jgi:hypothetical protein
MYNECLYIYYNLTFRLIYPFFIGKKTSLDFIENKFLITSLYLHEMLNSVISLQKMLFETYNIDTSSVGHRIYNIKIFNKCYRIFKNIWEVKYTLMA